MHRKIKILGVPVDMLDRDGAAKRFSVLMKQDGCDLIVTPNAEIVLLAEKTPELKRIIGSAGLVIPDGIGLIYASRFLKDPLPERIPGIEFLEEIFGQLCQTGQSVFFFGGRPGIAERAAENVLVRHPGLNVAGVRNGYFQENEEEEIVQKINESGADFLCIALGAPKQEFFADRYKDRLKVKAAIGVGGSLDVLAGEVKRAPAFFCNHGLEWLYRLLKQPSRYKRMAGLPIFMLKVIFSGKNKEGHVI